ncbi:O-antigen polymerase [Salisediminibacterium halotolerans]|uniref:Oligosaccharide repeat unit polymerase n=1 Tax=Salisediminibacterium halotolerans TaxID=517425 RepID=A0A1H9QH23_9BACI|nr:O-antigen polymerase [Salisediminibacterium haloalkalitolerans]SER59826.1 oligosaccharide repeat unit polymerase [Salisediminibacterium haloalkalitolerans]
MTKSQYLKVITGLFIVSVLLVFIGVLINIPHLDLFESDLIRYDKFALEIDIYRLLLALTTTLVSSFLVLYFGVGFRLILTPVIIYLFLVVTLVYPGITLIDSFVGNTGFISFTGYSLSLIAFSIGVAFASLINNFSPKIEINNYYKRISLNHELNPVLRRTLITFSIVGSIIVITAIMSNNRIAIEAIIDFFRTGGVSESASAVDDARTETYYVDNNMINIFIGYIQRIVLPISSLVLFVDAKLTKNKKNLLFSLAVLSLVLLSILSTGQRLLLGQIFLIILVVLTFFYQVRFKTIFNILLTAVIILVIQTIALGRMVGGTGYLENLIMSLNRVVERIFLTKGVTTYRTFEYFEDNPGLRYGETIVNKFIGLGADSPTLAEKVYFYFFQERGTAGPQSFAEAYINFSMIGMIVFAFIIGFILQLISIQIIRRSVNFFAIVTLAYLSFLFGYGGYSDVASFKTHGAHVVTIFYFITILIVSVINKRHKINK